MKTKWIVFAIILLISSSFAVCQDSTYMVKDIWPSVGSDYRYPNNFIDVNGILFFVADDSAHGQALWKSDGTDPGTIPVKILRPDDASRGYGEVVNFNGTLLFSVSGYDTAGYQTLWKSGGLESNTVQVARINTKSSPSHIHYTLKFTNIGSFVAFRADDPLHGQELWKTDGTPSGTVMVKDIWPGTTNSGPSPVTPLNGTAYFSAAPDSIRGLQLWKSDGTENGTMMIKTIPGSLPRWGSFPTYLTAVGNTIFFSAMDTVHGFELWKSDGTDAGTLLVKEIQSGKNSGLSNFVTMEHPFVSMNEILFFPANDGIHGFELWKSDGSEKGTVMVKDINPGAGSSQDYTFHDWLVPSYAVVNDVLYFVADDGVHGQELWRTDGTEAGTLLVKDIYPGPQTLIQGAYPQNLTSFMGMLYFTASDSIHGTMLWRSDGTTGGTKIVGDTSVARRATSPAELTVSNQKLFFSASDQIHGRELWVVIPKVTSTGEQGDQQPHVFRLAQNFPNPFNPVTTIAYRVAKSGLVTITINDVLGRVVAKLVNAVQPVGSYTVQWNASRLSSGIYTYRLTVNDFTKTMKLILLK